jgi:hypothetical protein
MKKTLLFLLSMLTFSVFGMGQTTYYVNASTGDNDNDGSQGSPWQQIQYAIDQAVDGDIIQVAAGTYAESLHIYKSITINGELDQGNRPVIVPGANGGNVSKAIAIPLIRISFDDVAKDSKISIPVVSLNNLVLDAMNNEYFTFGILAERAALQVENLLIRNISGTYEAAGIRGYGLRSCSVSESVVQHVEAATAYGIHILNNVFVKDEVPPGDFQFVNNVIEYIDGEELVIGMALEGVADALIHGNTVSNLTAVYVDRTPDAYGIALTAFGPRKEGKPEITTGAIITDNLIAEINMLVQDGSAGILSSIGILLVEIPSARIQGNEIIRQLNVRKGEDPTYFQSGPETGIAVIGTPYNTCQISENEIIEPVFGMFLMANHQLMVDNNVIDRPEAGIISLGMPFYTKSLSEAFSAYPDAVINLLTRLGERPFAQNDTGKAFSTELFNTYLDNTISGNPAGGSMAGILALFPEPPEKLIVSYQVTMEGNTFEYFAFGLMISAYSGIEANVHQNVFNYNHFAVVNMAFDSGILKGIVSEDLLIDATFNYYGRPEGPGFIGSSAPLKSDVNGVSEGVLYSPWLGFEPSTPPGQMTYYVDDSGDIQQAIDEASPGDVIRILGGEYIGTVDASGTGVTLYPGNSPACIAITGDLTTDYGNTLVIDIEGLTPCTGYTQIDVDGNVDLNGMSLDIQLAYAPAIGDAFDIIVSNNPIANQFAQGTTTTATYGLITYNFSVAYDDNKVTLTVTEINDPAPIPLSGKGILLGVLLILGVSVFIWYKKKKTNITS